MASANPAVAEAETAAAGQRDELAESLAELFTNVSLMVRGELQLGGEYEFEFEVWEPSICAVAEPGFESWVFAFLKLFSFKGTNSQLALLEKMNDRVAQEYSNYGDVAAGLRVFVEQLNEKNQGFDEYVSHIDAIDQQVTEFEAVVSMLDKHVALLEKKVKSAYHISSSTQ
nr:biogenesis of lysosome-related organelles complex 1 subunit 2 isoform X1 [Setaria viridis]